jgi:hypothetical protein
MHILVLLRLFCAQKSDISDHSLLMTDLPAMEFLASFILNTTVNLDSFISMFMSMYVASLAEFKILHFINKQVSLIKKTGIDNCYVDKIASCMPYQSSAMSESHVESILMPRTCYIIFKCTEKESC